MKKAFRISALLLLVILVVTAFAMPASAKQIFTDLSPEHWCYSKIMDFEKKGYVCGYSDDTFRADRTITRAEYVKIVNNFFGYKPSEKTTSNFKDVNSGDWFMPYVNEAVDRGYIEGFEDGTFRPQDPIRRQEATVILARILKIDKEVYPADHKDGLAQYSDSDEVQEWARVAIHSYSVYNFINGYEDGTLRILRNVTRAETVELLHILEQKVIIDRKPGGGTKTPTLKPDIDVLNQNMVEITIGNEQVLKEEYTLAQITNSGWINKKNSSESKEIRRNGAFVNITSQTTGSTIHDTVDEISRKEEYTTTKRDEYDNKFFLTDGVYTVTAKATKSGRKDSSTAEREVKIDTVAPIAYGVASTKSGEIRHEQSITVSVKDPNLYKTNEISGLDKVAYAWFNADTEERVTSWVALSLVNGQAKVDAPVAYGSYKLGISAIDVAENTFGTKTEFNVKAEDISGDVPTNPSGDVDYDFVKEIESGEENPSGDDIVVIVGNNPPTIEDLILYTSVNELVSGELIGKDIDSGDVLSYELKDEPNYGTANVTGNETTYVSDKTGTYTYTVKVKDNHSGEAIGNVTVYVYDAEVEIPENPSGDEIKYPDLSGDKLIIFTGEEKDMTVTVAPSGEPIKDIKYNWSFKANEEKAQISSEADEEKVTVKGLIPGETKITVKVKVNIEKSNGETETVEIEKEITVVVLSRITIKIPSDSKTYDGTPLKAKNFEVVSGSKALIEGVMASGDQMTVRVSGERIDVGSSDAVLASYTILNRNSEDVAKYYVPTFIDGTLTIIAKKNEIVITANSDSKKYDGTVLKNSGYTYTSGVLVSGDILEAVVSGEQLNAGSGDNKVISYKVTRNGVDVTGNYTFGECVDGVLEVTKRKVTLTSASDVKQYDGTALTNDDVTVSGDGFVKGEGATYEVTGSQKDVGYSYNLFDYTLYPNTLERNYVIEKIYNTLTVISYQNEITVTVKGNTSGDKYDGNEKSVTGYKVVSITNDNGLYSSGDVDYSGDAIAKGTNAGIYKMGLKSENFINTNKNFAKVKFVLEEDGKLEIAKREVTLTSATDGKVYDGTPLTNDTITVSGDGFVDGEGAEYDVKGTITNVGEAKNEFTYALNKGTLAGNYEITTNTGILKVTPVTEEVVVKVKGNSASGDKYDGNEKSVTGYEVISIINDNGLYSSGDVDYSGDAIAKGTNAGIYKMGLKSENFINTNKNFAKVKFVLEEDGKLEIAKREVTLTSASASKVYDGTPLKNDTITVSGDRFVDGEGAEYKVTGRQVYVGSGENTFDYKLKEGTLADNYIITKDFGTLTVTACKDGVTVTITGNTADYKYDGQTKTVSGYIVSISNPLYTTSDFKFKRTAEVTAKNASDENYYMNLSEADFENISNNFTNVIFKVTDGYLKINKRNVTLTSASATKVYDGRKLTSGDVTVTGDGFVSGEGAMYDVTGTITNVGEAKNEFTYALNKGTLAGNYEITTNTGILKVTPVTEEVVVKVKGNSASGDKYDGNEKKVTGYEVVSITNDNGLYSSDDVSYSGDAIAKGTNAGTYKMGLSRDKFINTNENFANVIFVLEEDGKLEIAKREVTLTSATDSKVYDGTALTNKKVLASGDGFVKGEGATYDVTGTITNVGETKNEFSYTLKNNTSESNYDITKEEGTLEITPVTTEVIVTITGKNAEYKYDGQEKTVSGYDVLISNSLYKKNDFEFTGTAEVTAKNASDKNYNMNLSEADFENKNNNFTNVIFKVTGGYLKINKRNVTLTSASDEKEFDGTALTNNNVAISEDGFVSGEGATYTVTGTITNVGSVENSFTYTLNEGTLANNYNITKVEGTLKITEKIPSVTISITPDYPNNGKEAEPGDTISYDAKIKNNESYDINVKINIDSDSEFADTIEKITIYDKNGNEVGTAEIGEKITIPAGGTVKITYKSDVSTTHPINKEFTSTVKVSTETGKKISSKTVSNDIEKSVGVFDTTNKDKNVILILDLSGSMNDNTKDGKTTKIEALRTATQQFVDKLYNSSKETNTKVTLNVIGIGEAHGDYSPSKKVEKNFIFWTEYVPILVDERYGNSLGLDKVDAYLIDSYINTNANTWIKSSFISSRLNANGGTNIVGALMLANGIMDGTYTSKNGISNFITNADNYVVILTDGANGPQADEPISKDTDGLKYSKSLRDSGAGIYAVYFEGIKENENKIGKADLNTILNNEYPLYEASSADSLNMAFDSIASSISKNQSKKGKITATLPTDGKYFPIKVTCKENGAEKELFVINNLAELSTRSDMTIEGNKLTWNLSGSTYSNCEELKLKLTLDGTGTDGKTQDTLELLPSESGEKVEITPVEETTNITSGDTDKDEKITSDDKELSKENEATVSGDTEIKNNDDTKSSETVSGEDKVLNNKDVELDNDENEQQNEEEKQEENVDDKDENKEVNSENQVNEVEGKQDEKVGNQEENKEEPKLEEKNNEEVIIEEKKEPIIVEEKQDDDDTNDTSDDEKEIK